MVKSRSKFLISMTELEPKMQIKTYLILDFGPFSLKLLRHVTTNKQDVNFKMV